MSDKITLSNLTAFETFCRPGEVVEVRCPNIYGNNQAWEGFAKGTVAGYFDNHDEFVKAVGAAE